jgi:argininosuccinate lyase
LQLLKENLFPAFQSLNECLEMTTFMLQHIQVKDDILKDEKYSYLFSVEVVNNEVLKGVPFREAYKKVGLEIEKGEFKAPAAINHTHEGSIGNLCNKEIEGLFQNILSSFNFNKVHNALTELVSE